MARTLADLRRGARVPSTYHLGTLTTLRTDGSPHVVAVASPWTSTAGSRASSRRGSQKARNAVRGGRAAVSRRRRTWLTFEGPVRLLTDAPAVREAERRYALRYREPRPNRARRGGDRVDRVLGSARMFTGVR